MNKDLRSLREEINGVDISILNLINKRTELVKEIIKLKGERSVEYFDVVSENEMMEIVLKSNKGPLPNDLIKDIFKSILSASLKFMGISCEKKLLISSKSAESFSSIHEIFSLDCSGPVIIAGPCAIEKPEYLEAIAEVLKAQGLKFLRGGAYKPRTSPYEFQGLKEEGLKILFDVSRRYGLYSVTEVVDTRNVELVSRYVDVLQIGARNMHNFELLKEVGQTNHPILLKRGMCATVRELMLAAEYIILQGNKNVVVCERGIRTYETETRNTLDISSIPIIKKETHLPIIADLSHSLGRKDIINSIASAVLSAGADGIMVEVHPVPELALSDSKQQLNLFEFESLLRLLKEKKFL